MISPRRVLPLMLRKIRRSWPVFGSLNWTRTWMTAPPPQRAKTSMTLAWTPTCFSSTTSSTVSSFLFFCALVDYFCGQEMIKRRVMRGQGFFVGDCFARRICQKCTRKWGVFTAESMRMYVNWKLC